MLTQTQKKPGRGSPDLRAGHPWSRSPSIHSCPVSEDPIRASRSILFVTNLFLDLIVENIDIAIRSGELPDSSLIAQRIGKSVRYVSSPRGNYLCAVGFPRHIPGTLRQHQCVILHARNNEAEWHLVNGTKSFRLHVSGPVAARGFRRCEARSPYPGLAFRPAAIDLLRRADREWRTRPPLPDWSSPVHHAVYPTRRFLPAKLRVFLEHLKGWKRALWISAAR